MLLLLIVLVLFFSGFGILGSVVVYFDVVIVIDKYSVISVIIFLKFFICIFMWRNIIGVKFYY